MNPELPSTAKTLNARGHLLIQMISIILPIDADQYETDGQPNIFKENLKLMYQLCRNNDSYNL